MAIITKPQTARRPIHISDFTEEDLRRYPIDDGEPMADTEHQFIAITYMVAALKSRFADEPTVYVGGDMFIYYREGYPSRVVAPDVFVVFGAEGTHKRLRWRVWDEGGALPSFIMEVGSESTWREDAGAKRRLYADLGVEEYWRFDPLGGKLFSPVLIGERLIDDDYQPLGVSHDDYGNLRGHSRVLGLEIRVRPDGELRLYDSAIGQRLNSLEEEQAALQEEQAARERAEDARQQAEDAQRQAEAAQQQAEAAREQAEAENRRLREQLAKLQAGE